MLSFLLLSGIISKSQYNDGVSSSNIINLSMYIFQAKGISSLSIEGFFVKILHLSL
ncbi:hypothetical protein NLO413_0262 [Candidatus Neoehrlichia lotoris str. RAC413]|uniref:Uncharacterized protein n=2 Tax=Candidatus Neoehrlichia procyonis TaxID=467750 RepID=A0A0F3NMF7_9RICK|nr:hypothetical protein NLO413_0262 [Candidatus Neoehrlichia lotoris str. RAC413]